MVNGEPYTEKMIDQLDHDQLDTRMIGKDISTQEFIENEIFFETQ